MRRRRSPAFVPIIAVASALGVLVLIGIAVIGIRAATSLPDPCSLGPSEPKRVSGLRPNPEARNDNATSGCQWERYSVRNAAYLDVELTRSDAEGGVSESHDQFTKDRREDGGSYNACEGGSVRSETGLGDEAYSCAVHTSAIYGESKSAAKTYNMRGAIVEARSRNVIIEVTWAAATRYTSSGSDGKHLTGTYLSYRDAKNAVSKITTYLLTELK